MFNKFPKRTGIYHIRDGIENLELKVTLRHINSLLKLPKFDYNKNISIDWEERRSAETNDTVCIKWQEKLFSATEKALYRESKNCISEVQRKYNEWLRENEETNLEHTQHKSGSSRRNKKRAKKQQKEDKQTEKQQEQVPIHTYVHEDNFHCNDAEEDVPNSTHMYIYATIDVETELAHLQWIAKERMLHIYPDFNSFAENPYFIEIDKDYRHLYAYAVENISQTRISPPGGDLQLYLELPELKPHWRIETVEEERFPKPPKHTRRVSLLLELRTARNFEYDNLHVRYYMKLPAHTRHEEGLLESSTHTSSMSNSGSIHHFGYNWQFTLLCEELYDGDYGVGAEVRPLRIFFEVISIDTWERERVEGYACFAVNLLQASRLELHQLQCLRPVESFWGALERYFIGGRRKFDFERFFEQSSGDADIAAGLHCRYGCRMQCTGILELSCQILTQKNCELLAPCANRKIGMTLDDIMQAYRETRKRLEALISK